MKGRRRARAAHSPLDIAPRRLAPPVDEVRKKAGRGARSRVARRHRDTRCRMVVDLRRTPVGRRTPPTSDSHTVAATPSRAGDRPVGDGRESDFKKDQSL